MEIELKEVMSRLRDHGIEIDLTKEAKGLLIEKGFDPIFGARPLKRTIQRFLEDPLAEEIITNKTEKKKSIKVDAENGRLVFK